MNEQPHDCVLKENINTKQAVSEKSGLFSRIKGDLSKLSLAAMLLFLLAVTLIAAFTVIFVKYAPKQTDTSSQQASTRAASEAVNYLKNCEFASLSYPTVDIMKDGILFSDIFNSDNFVSSTWECNLTKAGYLLTFSGVPRCIGDINPSNVSVTFEMPTSLNGVLTITSFSLSFADGAYHSFSANDATPSDRYKSLVRTQNAFETHICTLFPSLANESNISGSDSSHKAFVL